MRKLLQLVLFLSASMSLLVLAARAQDDAPSLGDVARQARQQKQQKDVQAQPKDAQSNKDASAKDAQSKDAQPKDAQGKDKDKDKDTVAKDAQPKTPHVITNDEIPEHIGPTRTRPSVAQNPDDDEEQPDESEDKVPPEYWKSAIQMQKNGIASLRSQIDQLVASIQYAGGNCVSNCAEWNERQKQKQDQVDAMKVELQQQEKRLEDMQEACRKQGYGSSVYDP